MEWAQRRQRRPKANHEPRSRPQGVAKHGIAIRRARDAPGDDRARASAGCPAEHSKRRKTGGFIPADWKKGLCMKLCAIVFEFHHTPTAMSGVNGHTASIT